MVLIVTFVAILVTRMFHGHVLDASLIFVLNATKRKIIKNLFILIMDILWNMQHMKTGSRKSLGIKMDLGVIYVRNPLTIVLGNALHANLIYAIVAIRSTRSQIRYNKLSNHRLKLNKLMKRRKLLNSSHKKKVLYSQQSLANK